MEHLCPVPEQLQDVLLAPAVLLAQRVLLSAEVQCTRE